MESVNQNVNQIKKNLPELYYFTFENILNSNAPIVQLDRTLDSGSKGWRFESSWAY